MTTGHKTLIPNTTGRTKYHNDLLFSEIKEAFPDCQYTITREVKRLEKELSVYKDEIKRIENSTLIKEHQDFLIQVLKEIYMKPDKRFRTLNQLKALQQFMRHQKYGISSEEIDQAKRVDIWTLYDFKKSTGKTACCPFHQDDRPSFAVRKRSGVQNWICFGCQKKGSGAIDFIMELNQVGFVDAVKILKERI